MPVARPTKYDEKYCEMAIESIGNQGKSITQFARDIRVSKSTVYLWEQEHPAFSDALTLARDWSEAFWEDRYVEFMVDRDVNSPLIKLYFANRFKWSEKQETEEKQQDTAITINLVDAKKPDGN